MSGEFFTFLCKWVKVRCTFGYSLVGCINGIDPSALKLKGSILTERLNPLSTGQTTIMIKQVGLTIQLDKTRGDL